MAEKGENFSQVLENVPEVNSEEELLKLIGSEGEKEGEDEEGDKNKPPEKEPEEGEGNLIDIEESNEKEEDNEDKDKNKPSEDTKEYNNLVEFINDKYELNLNVDQLPKDLSREQEAEIVSNLYDRAVKSANSKIGEYEQIEEILKDKEVASFLEAKRNGKTMKDFVSEYAGDVAGKSNEEIVKDSLKKQFPNSSDEDIQEEIDSLKDRGKLDKLADQAREKAINDSETAREAEKEKNQKKEEQDQLDRDREVETFKGFVNKVNSVYGVPVDDTMRQQVIVAATQTDDKGLTYLDKALQSDQGILLATMGLLHMEKLVKANKTTLKNRARNDIMERLIADPKELQSSSHVENTEEFDVDAANSF